MNLREGLLLLRNQNVYIIVGSLCPNENKPQNRGRSYIVHVEFKEKTRSMETRCRKRLGSGPGPAWSVAFKLALAWQGLLLRGWDQSRHVAWWETLRGFALRDHWQAILYIYTYIYIYIFACMRPDLHVSTEVGFMYIYIYIYIICLDRLQMMNGSQDDFLSCNHH